VIRNVVYKGKTLLRLNNKKNQEYFTSIIKNDINDLNEFECENKTQNNLKFGNYSGTIKCFVTNQSK